MTRILIYTILIVNFLSCVKGQHRRRATTTTEAPDPAALTLNEREANLIEREEKFRGNEMKLSLREQSLRLREDKISVREDKLKILEKSRIQATVTPPPDLTKVRFHLLRQKYEEIGSTDVCPENMKFYATPGDSRNGTCDCDIEAQCSRPLIYSDKYDQCFWAWSQGPCEQNEWVTFNETTMEAICRKNECPQNYLFLETTKYFFKEDGEDGKCYETTTKGNCTEGETLLPTNGDPMPKCRSHSLCYSTSLPLYQLCIPGSKLHFEGRCNLTE